MRDSVEKVSTRGFRLVAADVQALAQKAFERLWMQQIAPVFEENATMNKRDDLSYDEQEMVGIQQARNQWIFEMFDMLLKSAPETYKLWPWLARAWKKTTRGPGDPTLNPKQHIRDILVQATTHLDKMRDDPRPDVQVPDVMRDFKTGWGDFEQWVYQENAKNMDTQLEKDRELFAWPDGWRMVEVDSENLGWEGEQMGHCVGGYCRSVDSGDTHIISLRDPKGEPHVTFEVRGKKGNMLSDEPGGTPPSALFDKTADPWRVVQIQGKQDREPIPEYRERIKQFMEQLRSQGVEVAWDEGAWRPGQQQYAESWHIGSAQELLDWWGIVDEEDGYTLQKNRPTDVEAEYDEYGLPKHDFDDEESFGGDPEDTLIDILRGMTSFYRDVGDTYNDYSELIEAFPVFLEEYFHDNDPGADAARAKSLIENGYQFIQEQADDYRDQNWEWEHIQMKEWWDEQEGSRDEDDEPVEMPGYEELEEYPGYEEAQDEIAKGWYEPWSRADQFLKELSKHFFGAEYPWSPEVKDRELGEIADSITNPQPETEVGIPGALSTWMRPSTRYAFMMVAADIAELAARQRQNLEARDDLQALDPRQKGLLRTLLNSIEDENYKLMPWAVREWKKGRLSRTGIPLDPIQAHAYDIINQAGRWITWANEYHKSVPDYMSKQFMFEHMEQWVYQMSAENKTETEEESQWADETKVHTFPDNWYMAVVGPDDARLEGELMGHCVGGYCDNIRRGDSWIYSLRDPKGDPHVTLEFSDYGPTDGNDPGANILSIVQIQGKSDRKPIPEYQEKIKQWLDSLKEMGYQVEWASNAVGHDPYGEDEYVDPEYDYDQQTIVPVKKLSDLPEALTKIEYEGMSSFSEDHHTGDYKDVERDNSYDDTDEYGLAGKSTTQAEIVIPASFVELGDGGSQEGHDYLIKLWQDFLNQLIQNPNKYSEEDIQNYVKAFFFIPLTDRDQGRYYPTLPKPEEYLAAAQQMQYAAPKGPKPPQEEGLFDPTQYSDQFTSPRIWAKFQEAVNYMYSLSQGYTTKEPGRRQRYYEGMPDTWQPDPEGDPDYRYFPERERTNLYTDVYQLKRNSPGQHYYQVPGIPGAYSHVVYALNQRTGKVEAWDLEGKVVGCYDWADFGYKDSTWKLAAEEGQWGMSTQPDIAAPEQAVMTAMQADPAARGAYEALSRAGGHVYAVGGAIRDAMLGKTPKDIDLMVVGLPAEQVQAALATLGPVNLTGQNFGVYRVRVGDHEVEVALPRSEQSTGAGHKDFAVNADHNITPEEDLLRRDFTANAMAYSLDTGELLDPYNGRGDLTTGTLRTVSPQSFADDPLRIMRALVAQARHGLAPDEETMEQMREHGNKIRHLPGERIQMELDKLLSAADPVAALEIADQAGVLDYMLPEVGVSMGFEQNNEHHDLDVGNHLLAVLGHMANISDDPDLRLAALLHDIGKPDSYWEDEQGRGHFYEHKDYPNSQDHDKLGGQYADALMRRLKYPNDRIERVKKLIDMHMFPAFTNAKGARKFLQKAGDEKMAWDLMRLRMADHSGKSGMGSSMGPKEQGEIQNMMTLLSDVLDAEDTAVSVKDLAIDGKDLLSIGIPQGPLMGQILNELLELVVADPTRNDREELLGLARQYA